MLANKENVLIHGPQAGKVNPKTPAPSAMNPKTPFKLPLNDENTLTVNPKQNLFAGKDPSLFVTPVGPRRIALAGKDTNFKTRNKPGSIQGKQEKEQKAPPSSTRPVRTRVLASEVVKPVHGDDHEFPEIEYMPPRPTELPDVPDDFMLPDYEGLSKNLFKQCHRVYLDGVDESGKTKIERQYEESNRLVDEMLDAETEELLTDGKKKRIAPVPKYGTISSRKSRSSATVRSKQQAGGFARSTSSSRASSRASSRPSSSLSRPTSRRGPSTASTKAASVYSQRSASSASNSRVPAASRSASYGHSRSISASVINKAPLSFSRGTKSANPRPDSRFRKISATATATNSKSTIGYASGREIAKDVKKVLHNDGLEEEVPMLQEEEDDAFKLLMQMAEKNFLKNLEAEHEDFVIAPEPFIMENNDDEEFFLVVPE